MSAISSDANASGTRSSPEVQEAEYAIVAHQGNGDAGAHLLECLPHVVQSLHLFTRFACLERLRLQLG